jgi:hypothetical protein
MLCFACTPCLFAHFTAGKRQIPSKSVIKPVGLGSRLIWRMAQLDRANTNFVCVLMVIIALCLNGLTVEPIADNTNSAGAIYARF